MADAGKSLFPLFPSTQRRGETSSIRAAATDWLVNNSFAEELLPAPAPVPQVFAAAQLLESSDEEESPKENHTDRSHFGDIEVPAGPAVVLRDEDDGRGRRKGSEAEQEFRKDGGASKDRHREGQSKHKRRRKNRSREKEDDASDNSRERRHRKRRKEREKEKEKAKAEAASLERLRVPAGTDRKAAVKTWVEEAPLTSEYYFDTKGDRDNLAFGSLYRLDVARYHRQPSQFVKSVGLKNGRLGGLQEPEEDASAQVVGEKRYWGPGHAIKEKSKKLKRVKAAPRAAGRPSTPPGGYIPLSETPPPERLGEEVPVEEGESVEDSLLRRTREFNELTRTRPQELQGWLDFAAFQDELVKVGRKREAVQALDKKLAIHEKALDHHPDSDELLLAYLTASAQRDDAPTLQAKWAKVLDRLSGSALLWREYIRLRKGQYSSFSVSDVGAVYAQAVAALAQERNRIRREGAGEDKVGQVERELVRIFLDTCLFEWQTGHHELAVGLLQAQAEYSVFGPRIQASEASKQTLFQRFWDSGAPRIGESGAVGWGTWLAKEEERLQNWGGGVGEAEEEEEEKGGWSGWQDLKEIGGPGGGRGSGSEGGGQSDGEDEGSEGGEVEEESDEALLKRLGINLDAADAVDAAGVDTWRKWAVEEETRDEQQWLPVRPREGEVSDAEETDGELQRTVLFDDVQPFFFSLETDAAGDELLAGFGGFCEAPIPPLTTSNEAQWTEARELITGSLRDHLIRATAEEGKADVTFTSAAAAMPEVMQTELRLAQGGEILANLVGGPPWLDQDPPERRQFAANLLLQASGAFPASSPIARALLAVTSAGDVSGREARGLAKALLKGRREDLALWGAYAELEARAGNAGAARKVFGTALGSVSALPPAAQERAPELCLSFAEMELRLDEKTGGQDARGESNGQMGSGRQAALHILACFGEGEAFRPTETGVVTPSRILKAKKGYRDKLQQIRANTLRHPLTDADVATIGCAALFEDLSGGDWQAAAATYEDALNLGLPGKRAKSPQYERLVERYIQTLAQTPAKPARQRQAVLRGLATFPRNPELLSALVRGEAHQALANRLRRYFDTECAKAPSTVGWLFALVCEMGRPGAAARIRSLFERALSTHETSQSVVLWRAYLAYELEALKQPSRPSDRPDAARRVFFRALHACPWAKTLWLDGFKRLTEAGALTGKELGDLCETMREKEMRIRTDIYEILLQEAEAENG